MKVTPGNHYLAFVLDAGSRDRLLKLYPPKHEIVKCHHVTICYDIEESHLPYLQRMVDMNAPAEICVVGYIQADGIDLFPVMFDFMPIRTDGRHYHLTHSVSTSRQASDSNRVFSKEIAITRTGPDILIQLTGDFQLIPYTK